MNILGIYNCSKYDKEDLPTGSITEEEVSAVRRRYIINGLIEEESKAQQFIVLGLLTLDSKDQRIHGFDRYDFLGDYKEVGIDKNPYIEFGSKHRAFVLR